MLDLKYEEPSCNLASPCWGLMNDWCICCQQIKKPYTYFSISLVFHLFWLHITKQIVLHILPAKYRTFSKLILYFLKYCLFDSRYFSLQMSFCWSWCYFNVEPVVIIRLGRGKQDKMFPIGLAVRGSRKKKFFWLGRINGYSNIFQTCVPWHSAPKLTNS